MNHKFKTLSVLTLATLSLVACSKEKPLDNSVQVGANPELPKAEDFLIPPMQVPKYAGWATNALPKVTEDLKIEKIAALYTTKIDNSLK